MSTFTHNKSWHLIGKIKPSVSPEQKYKQYRLYNMARLIFLQEIINMIRKKTED
jgi:hypothetical protein